MFEPKLTAERKVSFEEMDLTRQRLWHFCERKCAQACCRDWKRRARSRRPAKCLWAVALNACRLN